MDHTTGASDEAPNGAVWTGLVPHTIPHSPRRTGSVNVNVEPAPTSLGARLVPGGPTVREKP